MENKKNLKVNCAVCDVRNITEDLLSTYAQVAINSATIITNPAAQALLEEQLLKQLEVLIGEDGEVESTRFAARISDGRLEVTLTAQCLEEIGEERPGEGAVTP